MTHHVWINFKVVVQSMPSMSVWFPFPPIIDLPSSQVLRDPIFGFCTDRQPANVNDVNAIVQSDLRPRCDCIFWLRCLFIKVGDGQEMNHCPRSIFPLNRFPLGARGRSNEACWVKHKDREKEWPCVWFSFNGFNSVHPVGEGGAEEAGAEDKSLRTGVKTGRWRNLRGFSRLQPRRTVSLTNSWSHQLCACVCVCVKTLLIIYVCNFRWQIVSWPVCFPASPSSEPLFVSFNKRSSYERLYLCSSPTQYCSM